MITKEHKVKKYCLFYASDFHLEMILLPYIKKNIYKDKYDMKKLRSKVGLVFQYPEHQLFETEIFKDVCFGPKNLGLSQKEVEIRAFESLRLVGIDDNMFFQRELYESEFYKKQPYEYVRKKIIKDGVQIKNLFTKNQEF